MNPAAAPRISPIRLPDPAWRYLILFQSWAQFISWATLLTVTMGAFAAAVVWLDGDVGLIPGCAVGAAIDGSGSLLFASKAQFAVRGAVPSGTTALATMLTEWRYVECQGAGQGRRFRQNLPAWLRWSESEVTIAPDGGALVCTGPQLPIRQLRKTLLTAG